MCVSCILSALAYFPLSFFLALASANKMSSKSLDRSSLPRCCCAEASPCSTNSTATLLNNLVEPGNESTFCPHKHCRKVSLHEYLLLPPSLLGLRLRECSPQRLLLCAQLISCASTPWLHDAKSVRFALSCSPLWILGFLA